MKIYLIPLALVCLLILPGCASRKLGDSWCGPLPVDAAVSSIASDAVTTIVANYPLGHTSVFLQPTQQDKLGQNAFAVQFESALRAQGATLVQGSGKDILTIAYTLDELQEENAWYLQLRLSDGRRIARSYNDLGMPEAGQSQITVGEERSTMGKMVDTVSTGTDNALEAGAEVFR